MSLPVVAIVGRPNVGKSTLFNRLVGFRKAVVHDRPGVTRDRLYETAEALGRRFMAIDTGGIEPQQQTPLFEAMRRQVMLALEEADAIVFVVDARSGFTPADMEVADLLRRTHKAVVLAVNKVDGERHEELAADFWQVGIEPLVTISAAHGRGIYDLLEAVIERLPPPSEAELAEDDEDEGLLPPEAPPGTDPEDWEDEEAIETEGVRHLPVTPLPSSGPLRIAVIGRPNIGKSTLINRLLGEDRHVVHDMPGTTMDPVDSLLQVGDREILLVDTAGVRRRSRIDDPLERFVSLRAIRAIERCHVALLLVDATEGITDQDARLAHLVEDRGRALVILFNKWDLVRDLEDVDAKAIEEQRAQRLPHVSWAPHLFISAKTRKGLHRVLPAVEQVFAEFNRRVPTADLNRFLERTVSTTTPPQRHHRPVRLYYATQTRIRPPTFAIFSNTPEGVVQAYRSFLANQLRKAFGFEGTPLRLHFKRRRKLGE